MQQFFKFITDVYVQLNMFRASSLPSSGATTTAVAASGLPSEHGGSSAVGRGRADRPARPRPTAEDECKRFVFVEPFKFTFVNIIGIPKTHAVF